MQCRINLWNSLLLDTRGLAIGPNGFKGRGLDKLVGEDSGPLCELKRASSSKGGCQSRFVARKQRQTMGRGLHSAFSLAAVENKVQAEVSFDQFLQGYSYFLFAPTLKEGC